MFDIGQICIKIAGRDAGKKCVIVSKVDEQNVLVDGQTRRRNCNLKHLEPTSEMVKLKDGATHAEVKKVLEGLNIQVRDKKSKEAKERPKKVKAKSAPVVEKPKKAAKKKDAKKVVDATVVKETPKAEETQNVSDETKVEKQATLEPKAEN